MKKIKILCGLPGSGKTYYANYQKEKIINVDELLLNQKNIEKELQKINKKEKENLIVDGLFLNNYDYTKLINIFNKEEIEFHFWIPNRDNCLHNDKNRRVVSSEITIKYAQIEEPILKELKKINPKIKLIKHIIKRKED